MQNVYQKRLTLHQKRMMRYLKYVLNDHFVIVCVFLIGGLGFYYSEQLKTISTDVIWVKPVVGVIWLLSLFIGRLATLAKEADKVFLLPKEKQLWSYFRSAIYHSFLLPAGVLIIIVGMTMPLLVATTMQPFSNFFYYLLIVLMLKLSELFLSVQFLLQENKATSRDLASLWFVGSILAIAMSLYGFYWIGILISIVVLWLLLMLANKNFQRKSLDWDKFVNKEQIRLRRIYQFFNLFTDVPEISSRVHRRKYLDWLLQRIQSNHSHTYFYLYTRSFLRGNEYSGLYIRLVAICFAIVFFLSEFWMTLGVSLLFVYLIGFQLLPLYGQFDYMTLTKLYPVSSQQKTQAVAKLVSILLFFAAILFSVATIISLQNITDILIVIGSLVGEVIVFVKIYIPHRLKKMEQF